MTKSSVRGVDIGLWLGLAAAWSSSYAVIKIGVGGMDPMLLVAGRMGIATVLFVAILIALGRPLSRHLSDWVSYGVTGLLGSVIPFLLITYAEQSVDSALAAILMGLAPVSTAMLAGVVLPEERLTRRLILGLVGALIGVALLAGPAALRSVGAQVWAQLAIVGATLCYAGSTVYTRRYVKRPPLEMAAGSSLVGVGVMIGAILLMRPEVPAIQGGDPAFWPALFAVIYLGVVSTAGANLTYFYLVPRLGATRMSQVNFAVPVGGALLGALLLNEPLVLRQVLALGLIIGSVWLATTRAQMRTQDRTRPASPV